MKDHCQNMHTYLKKHNMVGKMIEAFATIPDLALLPVDAYRNIVKKNVEFVELRNIDLIARPRVAGVMLVPYPPGIPIIMGGETFNANASKILEYLLDRQDFENEFPGYENEIHGIQRTNSDENGKRYFGTLLVEKLVSR